MPTSVRPLERPRRMALVPLPVPGESFSSWMDAVALENLCWRSTLLAKYWRLRAVPYAGGWEPGSSTDLAHISIATGITEDDLAAMLLNRYFEAGFPALPVNDPWTDGARDFIGTEFRLTHHSRWCPHCIRENGGRWMLRWRLAWSYACPIHEVFLAFRCPSCRSPQDTRTGPPSRRLTCSIPLDARRSTRPCGQPLTDIPVIPVTDRRLLQLQAWIDHGLGDGPRPTTGPSAQALFAFPVTVSVALQLRTPEMFTTADPAIAAATADPSRLYNDLAKFHGSTEMAHPLLIAGAIGLADHLTRGQDRREAAATFADLAHAELEARTSKWSPYEPLPVPGRLTRYIYPAVFATLVDRGVIQDSSGY
ncbi:TniQ family protein [Streptomyces sp. H10-C2]|uniref:TniQ family protein n=1 Tax=unclassified Streptomyces TaxID=2593676 RepID=UPI0024B88B06|nr:MULTISPECIES: TniQ family protein [unclassified Streptomyces]MDJ0340416.1 TniQ family protein [Streptomyces sp. PH10-H1]MDJ0368136.1 TniQ family protein [Streptomyces sp. H10-C2]